MTAVKVRKDAIFILEPSIALLPKTRKAESIFEIELDS